MNSKGPTVAPVKADAANTTATDPTRSLGGVHFSAIEINDFANALHHRLHVADLQQPARGTRPAERFRASIAVRPGSARLAARQRRNGGAAPRRRGPRASLIRR